VSIAACLADAYGTTGTIMMIVLNRAGSAPRFGFK
jgi:hypothetical protein